MHVEMIVVEKPMHKSCFHIPQMDCAAEENLVRMKLEPVEAVQGLEFDLSKRLLTVFHEAYLDGIEAALYSLNLGAQLLESAPTQETVPTQARQRKLLWIVLVINAAFFAIEMTTGLISRSMGLVADSLDMLADALVYALSLLAVGASVVRKKQVARWSGYFQLSLAILGFVEVLRRFLGFESLPDFRVMIVVAALALIANTVCLYVLQRSHDREAHMQASMIFTSNDIIINLGVIIAGLLVNWLDSGTPDLIVGALVFVVVIRGAMRILKLAN